MVLATHPSCEKSLNRQLWDRNGAAVAFLAVLTVSESVVLSQF